MDNDIVSNVLEAFTPEEGVHLTRLEMQDIIIEQEETIRELESVLDDKNHLLGSFDFDSLEKELNILEQNCWHEGETQIINITKIIDNFKLRIQQ